ncbi:hypothetical protein [Nocardia sp. AG03]|uniref:hypothetical protein n=1 Tax=Nocardia sp. AG03 TaxID=3025312 RepID=UPI0024189466|nr:hypothetical protein [Nocardia sp. AG03]
MTIPRKRLGRVDDLNTALRTISEFNRVILAADTKAGLLLTANGFALTGLVTVGRTGMSATSGAVAIVLSTSLIVCMGYLGVTLRPDLRGAGAGNWFCFLTFPEEGSNRPPAPALADHAWRQAGALAEIARRKYRRFAVALRWSAVSVVVFVVWLLATLWG